MKVSVVLPVYNSEEYLEESIESILGQTISNLELIIVLDQGNGHSKEIAERYNQKDSRVRLSVNDGLGLAKCLNKGIEMADGKYIARQDADDISQPKRLEKQYKFLEKNKDIFLCGTEAKLITEKHELIGRKNLPENPEEVLPQRNKIMHPSVMFRNYNNLKYREKFVNSEDYDLWLRTLSQGKKMRNLKEPLIKYRIRRDAVSSSKKEEMDYFGKKAREFYKERKNGEEDSYYDFEPKDDFKSLEDSESQKKNYWEKIVEASLKVENYELARKYSDKLITEYSASAEILPYYLSSQIPIGYKLYRKIRY